MKPAKFPRLDTNKIRIKSTHNLCKKVYFGTKEAADEHIKKRSTDKNAKPAESYLCHKCNAWHITSWTSPDVDKVFKEHDQMIDEFIEEYYQAVEANNQIIKKVFEKAQETEINYYNVLNELIKLKRKYAVPL